MQQPLKDFRVEVTGEREKIGDVNLFKKINLHFILQGELNPQKVERAIELSVHKYCSVAKMIEGIATITTSYELIG
jgi:putative redox protein